MSTARELQSIDDEELAHCRNVLLEETNHKKQRHYDSVQKCIVTNHVTKSHDAPMEIRCAHHAPLLFR